MAGIIFGMLHRPMSRGLAAWLALVLALTAGGAFAQARLGGLNEDKLEDLQRQVQGQSLQQEQLSPVDKARQQAERAAQGAAGAAQPTSPVSVPAKTPPPLPPSASPIEQDYSARIGEHLTQFGYDVFRASVPNAGQFVGAVNDQYRMGIGDQVVVTFQGQESKSITTRVDREGRVILPDLPPISAAGRTFGEFREELERRVSTTMIGTQVFVSMGALRMIRVIVAGEVQRPGLHYLTGLATVIDALYAAGGISKTGSLRRIRVNRRHGALTVDFYELLLKGRFGHDNTLMDGDQIVVPAIGPTVAVAGEVKRPRIFELRSDHKGTSLAEVVAWAGGPLRPSGSRYIHMRLDEAGQDQVSERSNLKGVPARDGDIVLVQERGLKYQGSVMLTGHVRAPGMRSVAATRTVSRLVGSLDSLEEEPYLPFAALSRLDRKSGARDLHAVDLSKVLRGEADETLQADDVFIVLSLKDVQYLTSADVQNVLSRKPPVSGLIKTAEGEEAGVCRGLVALSNILASEHAGRFAVAVRGLVVKDAPVPNVMPCPAVYDEFPELLVFVLEHAVALNSEVRTPGIYLVLPGTSLASITSYAGGLTREADRSNVEVSRFELEPAKGVAEVQRVRVNLTKTPMKDVRVSPGDLVRFNAVFSDRDTGPVFLFGEVKRPGGYDITRGERMSHVIARAGGLTAQAYPYGAVFTRESAKQREKENFQRYAVDLRNGLTIAISSGRVVNQGASAATEVIQQLIRDLKETEPVGRVVVEADPTVLQVHPEQDTVLEPGDRLYIPKRPNSVTVTGSVLNPGSVAFRTGTKVDGYIAMVGGYAPASEEGRTFVVYPNGIASPVKASAWDYNPEQVPPGSTVVVPRDPRPFDWLVFSREITDILSKVAITAASLAVISNSNK